MFNSFNNNKLKTNSNLLDNYNIIKRVMARELLVKLNSNDNNYNESEKSFSINEDYRMSNNNEIKNKEPNSCAKDYVASMKEIFQYLKNLKIFKKELLFNIK